MKNRPMLNSDSLQVGKWCCLHCDVYASPEISRRQLKAKR